MKTKINWSIVQMTLTMIIGNIISMIVYAIILSFTGEEQTAGAVAVALAVTIAFAIAVSGAGAFAIAGAVAIASAVAFASAFAFAIAGAVAIAFAVAGAVAFGFAIALAETKEKSFSFWKIFLFSIVLIGILGMGDFFFITSPQTSFGISILILAAIIAFAILGFDIQRQKKGKKSIFANAEKETIQMPTS